MSYNTPALWLRKITLFDIFYACSPCRIIIKEWETKHGIIRWHCDTCRKRYVPFFDQLLVSDDDSQVVVDDAKT